MQNPVRADLFEKCWQFLFTGIRLVFFGFPTLFYEYPDRFEPIISFPFAVSDLLLDIQFAIEQHVLLLHVGIALNAAIQMQIEQLSELPFDFCFLLQETANRCPTVGNVVHLLLFDLCEHVLRPRIGQRHLFDDIAHLLK